MRRGAFEQHVDLLGHRHFLDSEAGDLHRTVALLTHGKLFDEMAKAENNRAIHKQRASQRRDAI